MASAPARPPALTLTCVFLGVGSLLLLLELITILGSWGSIELQDGVREVLATPEVRPLDIGLDTALEVLRWFVFGLVALAASALVFTIYTARGHLVSRVVLTVMCGGAALMFALGLGIAGILPALFASICASSLWSPDARRWFDAVNGRPVSHPQARLDPHAPGAAPAVDGAAVPGVAPASAEGPWSAAGPVPVPGPTTATQTRPRAVLAAVLTTTIAAGLAALAAVVLLLVTTIGPDTYRAAAADSPLGDSLPTYAEFQAQFVAVRWFAAGALVLGALAVAAALALLSGSRLGAVALAGLSGVTVAYSLFVLVLGIPTMIAAIFVILQVRRPEVRAWLEEQREQRQDASRTPPSSA